MINQIQADNDDDRDLQPEAIAENILNQLGYTLHAAPARDCFRIVRNNTVITVLTRREIVSIAPTLEQEKHRGVIALDDLIKRYGKSRARA